MSLLQVLILVGVVFVLLAVLAALVGEVFGLNGRLDAADEEEWNEDWCWPHRIDQRRD